MKSRVETTQLARNGKYPNPIYIAYQEIQRKCITHASNNMYLYKYYEKKTSTQNGNYTQSQHQNIYTVSKLLSQQHRKCVRTYTKQKKGELPI